MLFSAVDKRICVTCSENVSVVGDNGTNCSLKEYVGASTCTVFWNSWKQFVSYRMQFADDIAGMMNKMFVIKEQKLAKVT